MREKGFVEIGRLCSQGVDGALQVDGIPQDDGSAEQIESTGPVTLIFKGSIAHFSQAMKENGSCQGVSCFSFIEADMNAPPQFGVLKPLQHEKRSFEPTEFAQRQSESILAGISAEFSQQHRSRSDSYGDGRTKT